MEDYYGHTGAFRCLVEGGGNVAFVKHTTVMENCDGKRKEWWARNQLTTDFELLCRDGTRRQARDYKNCFLGRVNSNALVTRKQSEERINAFINLFKYAQQFYGQKVPDEFSFSMFYSPEPYADLIFQVKGVNNSRHHWFALLNHSLSFSSFRTQLSSSSCFQKRRETTQSTLTATSSRPMRSSTVGRERHKSQQRQQQHWHY